MITDSSLTMADRVAVPTGTAITNVGDQIDFRTAKNIGDGKELYACFHINTTFVSSGAAVVRFWISGGDSLPLKVDNSESLGCTAHVPIAQFFSGHQFTIPIPPNTENYRYLGVQFISGTAALTAGVFSAFLTYNPPSDYYPGREAFD